MELIFKKENEILKQINSEDITDEIADELKKSFDNEIIKSYEIIFKENVLVKKVHNLDEIDETIVSKLIITI